MADPDEDVVDVGEMEPRCREEGAEEHCCKEDVKRERWAYTC